MELHLSLKFTSNLALLSMVAENTLDTHAAAPSTRDEKCGTRPATAKLKALHFDEGCGELSSRAKGNDSIGRRICCSPRTWCVFVLSTLN